VFLKKKEERESKQAHLLCFLKKEKSKREGRGERRRRRKRGTA
jgi:hypothetical protein